LNIENSKNNQLKNKIMNSPIENKNILEDGNSKPYNLEDRLIAFALQMIQIVEMLPSDKIGSHIGGQLLRSGTSPALNYGEAQSAESKNDFIHKMKVCLKELKETRVSLKIIILKPLIKENKITKNGLNENEELIAIFGKSIETAKRNKQ
jgi:four helix bundle protein